MLLMVMADSILGLIMGPLLSVQSISVTDHYKQQSNKYKASLANTNII